MSELKTVFKDISGQTPSMGDVWQAHVIRKAEIDAEIERLLSIPQPDNGRRASSIVHPDSPAMGAGLAPGTDVTINVLKPGESTINRRGNNSLVEITLSGQGEVLYADKVQTVSKWDVWTVASMEVHRYHNNGKEPWVRLTYSNAPLLQKLGACFIEDFDGPEPESDKGLAVPKPPARDGSVRARDLAVNDEISKDGARVLGYEWLIDLDFLESKTLFWPWEKIASYLPSVEALDKNYNGRRLFVLYNPVTEKRIGTTPSFFATISSSPPNNNYIPHRHTSSAINYYLRGGGYSQVDGERIHWSAGDLLLSAPSWSLHSHHSSDHTTSALTIQDHPMHIAMNSLIWQERMNEKILVMGSEGGFETNRSVVAGN